MAAQPAPPPPQAELEAAPHHETDEPDYDSDEYVDADSALGYDAASSTNSLSHSIMEYRTLQGRTFHSERHESNYFTPNDAQQLESIDITHHYLTILLNDKLFLAPIKDNVNKALDVGTGTGIWAIDFADHYPSAEVVGIDLSPTQPLWVPPNVKFEIDDCTKEWTWPDNTFDFVHIRYMFGGIHDWNALFSEAYRVCTPGGWVQSCEADVDLLSDDGTVTPDSAMASFYSPLFKNFGKKIGNSFEVIKEDLQRIGFEKAGFEDIKVVDYKLPFGGWPADPKMAEVGQYTLLTILNDLEGYTLVPWNTIHGENTPGYQEMLAHLRRELKSKKIHSYIKVRYVYGRKPGGA